MSKKHFIVLAQHIIAHNHYQEEGQRFTQTQSESLASFCKEQNGNFNRDRWLSYVAGKCGPNGGKK